MLKHQKFPTPIDHEKKNAGTQRVGRDLSHAMATRNPHVKVQIKGVRGFKGDDLGVTFAGGVRCYRLRQARSRVATFSLPKGAADCSGVILNKKTKKKEKKKSKRKKKKNDRAIPATRILKKKPKKRRTFTFDDFIFIRHENATTDYRRLRTSHLF